MVGANDLQEFFRTVRTIDVHKLQHWFKHIAKLSTTEVLLKNSNNICGLDYYRLHCFVYMLYKRYVFVVVVRR